MSSYKAENIKACVFESVQNLKKHVFHFLISIYVQLFLVTLVLFSNISLVVPHTNVLCTILICLSSTRTSGIVFFLYYSNALYDFLLYFYEEIQHC